MSRHTQQAGICMGVYSHCKCCQHTKSGMVLHALASVVVSLGWRRIAGSAEVLACLAAENLLL